MKPLDEQLASLASELQSETLSPFPSQLHSSLRRRRFVNRARFVAVAGVPMCLLAGLIWISQSIRSQAGTPEMQMVSMLRADPSNLPASAAWQPAQLERAGIRPNVDLSGF